MRTPEENKIYMRKWYAENREYHRAKEKEYREKNYARYRERNALWIKNNPEKHREHCNKASAKYKAKNPEKVRATMAHGAHMRRARMLNVISDEAGVEKFIAETVSNPDLRCSYCDKSLSCKTVCFDHIVAIARGGFHIPSNLNPSCMKCNQRKGAKPLAKFLEILERENRKWKQCSHELETKNQNLR